MGRLPIFGTAMTATEYQRRWRMKKRETRDQDIREGPLLKGSDMNEISEDDLYVMANVYPDTSGLPMTVWVRPRGNERHGPRIKVCTIPGPRMVPDQTVTVTLPPTMRLIPPGGLAPDDLEKVKDWIRLNEAAIRAHWEGRIDGIEFGRRLQKLP